MIFDGLKRLSGQSLASLLQQTDAQDLVRAVVEVNPAYIVDRVVRMAIGQHLAVGFLDVPVLEQIEQGDLRRQAGVLELLGMGVFADFRDQGIAALREDRLSRLCSMKHAEAGQRKDRDEFDGVHAALINASVNSVYFILWHNL